MNAAELDAQTRHSENLLLLNEDDRCRSGLQLFYNHPFNEIKASRNVNADLRILDIISTCLTTGEPGDLVAAVFDKRERLTLVLAKSGGICSAKDIAATHRFISALQIANLWTDLFPFLIEHGKSNMNKRIRDVRESIINLCDSGKFVLALKYLEDDFDQNETDSFLGLLRSCKESTDFTVEEDAVESSSAKYKLLHELAKTLLQSGLFKALCKNVSLEHDIQRFLRRLEKVCQYSELNLLIRFFKRLHSVPFHWIEYTRDNLRDTVVFSEDPLELLRRCLEFTPTPEDKNDILAKFPRLFKNWSRHAVKPHIHPEVVILLLYTRSFPEEKTDIKTVLPLGSSNGPCISCAKFIILLNRHSKIMWKTSGSSGKIYYDWALPRIADTVGIIDWDAMQSSLSQSVTNHMWTTRDFLQHQHRIREAAQDSVPTGWKGDPLVIT